MIHTAEVDVLKQRIDQLHLEHRDLDDVICRLAQSAVQDQLQRQRNADHLYPQRTPVCEYRLGTRRCAGHSLWRGKSAGRWVGVDLRIISGDHQLAVRATAKKDEERFFVAQQNAWRSSE